jgi:succinyl-diaminopimelate desuccinylase
LHGRRDLIELAHRLVSTPSVTGDEGALADLVEARLRAIGNFSVLRHSNTVLALPEVADRPPLVLAGHLDTVPPAPGQRPALEGETLWGRGSVDMKSGLAVMLVLASEAEALPIQPAFVFYEGEEGSRQANGLWNLPDELKDLLEADAAVLLEPTGGAVEAGCQGVLLIDVEVKGVAAHVARPSSGINAILRLAPVLEHVGRQPSRQVVVEGCTFRESLQPVKVEGGIANNVVPDRASLRLSYRFAPDQSLEAALSRVRDLLSAVLEEGDDVKLVSADPAAPPSLAHPFLARLVAKSGAPPRAKLGWTDVAFFAARGVPACNFGPGDASLAHRADEHVSEEEIWVCYQALREALSEGSW